MSIKDLFGKRSNQILTVEEYEKTVERNGESIEQIEERTELQSRFIPRASVDFDDPKTFARYGSAEKYYTDAINSILNTYPYDGSLSEKTSWHNGSTYVDNYIFENEYPRTTGYVSLNEIDEHPSSGFSALDGIQYRVLEDAQLIYVKGGPNPTPHNATGELRKEYPEGLGKSNIWNPDLKRESNLYCDGAEGNTVEVWFKMTEDREAVDGNLCLFDLWNNHLEGTEQFARFAVELPEDKTSSNHLLQVTYVSGSAGVDSVSIGDRDNLPEDFDFSAWNHYAVSVYNTNDSVATRFYLNGKLIEEVVSGTPVSSFVGETNHLSATIGSMHYNDMYGTGAIRGSLDEFRFWKSSRTSEQIGRSWFTQVNGGNNTDESNLDLGVYFKFNEGIYNTEKVTGFDRQVLDYSGRVSNGAIVNYSLSVRSLGSAIDEKQGINNTENKDPIVYRTHPDVQSLIDEKKLEGSTHDMSNNSAIYNTMPEWITTADEESAGQNLLDLTQVVSSYFDTLHLQIEALPSITNTHYVQDGEKPLPFAKHLLESVGFVAPEIFVDTTVLEALSDRNEERVFEEKLHDVKNLIYQNIYNNITGIYKAKGTEKSFRNLLRCFGVGDELIKINLYGDGVTHEIKDSYRSVSVKKNYLDFNNPDRHDSTVYQQAQPDNDASVSYIAGNSEGKLDYIPFTMEASVIFPKKFTIDHPQFYRQGFGFTEEEPSSVFGMHQAKDAGDDLTWLADPEFGFRVVCIKEDELSKDAKFRLDVRGFGVAPNGDNGYHNGLLETGYYYDVYDNSRWNFAVRVRMDKQPDLVHESDTGVRYYLELHGVSTILEDVQEEFTLSYEIADSDAKAALNANKRLFLGAEYVDFNDNDAGTLNMSDVKVGEVRYWQDYIDNETIRYHSQDPDNYGVKDPYKPAYFNQTSVDRRVPQLDTLCLYWDFATVGMSSPSDGIDEADNILSDSFFYVDDVTAGSLPEAAATGRYTWLGEIVKHQHTGKGDYYYPEDNEVVDRNFLFAAKQNLPEIIGSSDTIKLLTQDDDLFMKGSKPVNYFWAIEKSMYQAVSQEIMEAFAGISAFNNLIGDPVNRYRMEYKNLNKLRQLFFQKFQEAPKVERYVQFYKWIDSSISEMIQQLIPASANFSDDMRTVIESHILERNKYWTKYPSLEMKQTPPETSMLGINEMLYNWKRGHASVEEDENCLWWNDRAERKNGPATSGNDDVDDSREALLDVATTVNRAEHVRRRLVGGEAFALRSLSTPYRFGTDIVTSLHGGVNNKKNKKIDYVRAETLDNKDVDVILSTQPVGSDCTDDNETNALGKERVNIQVADSNGSILSLYEASEDVNTGERYWNSNHSDTYGDDKDVPMQGVFTSVHVGGLQNRNVKLNDGTDNNTNRPEAWDFTITGDEAAYSPVPSSRPAAKYYKDEKAKRPVNIRNIKSSYGNYRFDYEVVQTSGRKNNNRWLAEEIPNAEEIYSSESPHIVGMYDFELPDRGRNEHIIVERFSAPGSSDTLSRGMLDVESEEFALYNSLNFRNLDVRLHLKNWLTYHTKKWGHRSYYRGQPVEDCSAPGDTDTFCEANFHKTHRNTAYRPESYDYIEFFGEKTVNHDDPCCDCDDDEYAETVLTDYRCKETHDNFWITHQMPRSGHQYAWIKASTQKDIFEEIEGETRTYRVCPWGYATDYPNAIAYHPEIETSPTEKVGDLSAYTKMVVEHDEDGSVITEDGFPFITNFISYDDTRPISEIIEPDGSLCTEVYSGTAIIGGDILDDSLYEEYDLHRVLLHRNGPYQHPSWKQIRGYENPVVSRSRKTNTLSVLDLPASIRTVSQDTGKLISLRERRAQTAKNYVEPAVSWNVPMRSKMQFYNSPSAGTVVHSYSNNLEIFSNPYLDRRLGLRKTARQVYDVLVEKYVDTKNQFAPSLFEIIYVENIFPKHRNASLDKIRRRKDYAETSGYSGYDKRITEIRTFWAQDGRRERTRWTGDYKSEVAKNAFGYPERRSSYWALDYDATIGTELGKNVALRGDLAWSGDAQYRGYVGDSSTPLGVAGKTEFDTDAWIAPRPRLQFIHNPTSNIAPEQAWSWKASEVSGNTPFFNNYDEFSKDVRLIGQNYSLTPEFNISSHMDYYINKNAGNFKAQNKNILELPGAPVEVSSSADRYVTQNTYMSWDGITPVNPGSTFEQPNFANGWNKYFTGTMDIGASYDEPESVFILEQPDAIDRTNLNWKCAKPYPVCSFSPAAVNSLTVDFSNTGLLGYEGGINVGENETIQWNSIDYSRGANTTAEENAILKRWEKSVLFSTWINIESTGGVQSLFTLLGTGSLKSEIPSKLELGDGKILDYTLAKKTVGDKQLSLSKKILKLEKYKNLKDVSASVAKALQAKKDKLVVEISQDKKDINNSMLNLSGLLTEFPSLYLTRPTQGGLRFEKDFHTHGDVYWWDSNDNKIVFDVTAEDLINSWNSVCLYYIGGLNDGGDFSNPDTRPRVMLFLNGEYRKPLLHAETEELYSEQVSTDVTIRNSGRLLRTKSGANFDTIEAMKYGSGLRGSTTDLAVYRGNPGITNTTASVSQTLPAENRWFFDQNDLTTGDVYCSLAESIHDMQCENANDIRDEWFTSYDICTVDKITSRVVDIDVTNIVYSSMVLPAFEGRDGFFSEVDGFKEDILSKNNKVAAIEEYSPSSSIGALDADIISGISPQEENPDVVENNRSYCSRLIGWWRLGIPRWEKETCEEYIWKEEFFKCYSHTDKISHIEKVREDHKTLNGGTTTMMRLEVEAIKKLLPYNGFYPSQRTVQLGSLFYDSVIPHVEGKNDNQTFDRARTEQAALQPFFAPGILFNTIKSGIAVDWATYSKNSEPEMIQVLGETIAKDEGTGLSSVFDATLLGTKLGSVIKTNIAKDLELQMSLGKVKTTQEQEGYLKRSYDKNIKMLEDQVGTLGMQAQNECTQAEYEKYAKAKGLNPADSKTEDRFKAVYSCPEFKANQSSAIPALSEQVYSALGVTADSNKKAISKTAASAIEELKSLPRDISFKIPGELLFPIPPVKSEELEKFKEGKFLVDSPTIRLPFESLISLDSYLPQKNSAEESKIFFLAPSYYRDGQENVEVPYFEWNGVQNPLYEMAMNNFLAEVPNFFLKGGKMTSFTSQPENKFKPVKSGWTYYLDVHLYKTDEFDMTVSPHDGELLALDKDRSGRTFTTQGRYYGPAMKYVADNQSGDTLAIADPAQSAYTPPYFYGRAKARLSFTPEKDGQPSLEEILNNLEIEYINEEMDELFSSVSSSEPVSAATIFKAAIGVEEPSWKRSPAYQSRMPMEACIKFDGKVNQKKTSFAAKNTAYDYSPDDVERLAPVQVEDDNQGTGVWVISPRFECPTFNFKTSDNLVYREENSCGTGMWGGYGTSPSQKEQKSQGLFISIEESFKARGDKPNKPLMCAVTKKEVQSVALGIVKDTRYLHENVITLEDPYGLTHTVTIGQPRTASGGSGFDTWELGEHLEREIREIIGLPGLEDTSPRSTPYSTNACVRTVATSKRSSISEPYNGMDREFDVEAYLQAESWMTDVFSLWETPSSLVPESSDIANAIIYHINYLYEKVDNFPWKATVRWVNPFNPDYTLGGAAAIAKHSQGNTSNSMFYMQTGIDSVIEITYDESKAPVSAERTGQAKVTLTVNQDSVRNPLGKLGVRYINENGSVDLTSDSTDPESQVDMSFYAKSTTESVLSCIEAVGSLMDVCGFVSTKSRVGELTPSKEIAEAVVMIPFVDNPITNSGEAPTTQIGGRNFFSLGRELFKQTNANVNAGKPAVVKGGVYNVASDINKTSVSSMIQTMQKYNLPPQYDFIKYSDINPFVMYVFEFKDNLDVDDLTNIWQGLMPERARTAQQDVQTIEHELNEINFFEGKRVPKDIRWMVFRVKKKAKTSYWEMTADSGDDDRFKFDFNFGTDTTPDYNYNWPYDFCSLVEMCKIRGGVSVMPKITSIKESSEPIISDEEKKALIDNAHSQSGTTQAEQSSGILDWVQGEADE